MSSVSSLNSSKKSTEVSGASSRDVGLDKKTDKQEMLKAEQATQKREADAAGKAKGDQPQAKGDQPQAKGDQPQAKGDQSQAKGDQSQITNGKQAADPEPDDPVDPKTGLTDAQQAMIDERVETRVQFRMQVKVENAQVAAGNQGTEETQLPEGNQDVTASESLDAPKELTPEWLAEIETRVRERTQERIQERVQERVAAQAQGAQTTDVGLDTEEDADTVKDKNKVEDENKVKKDNKVKKENKAKNENNVEDANSVEDAEGDEYAVPLGSGPYDTQIPVEDLTTFKNVSS